MNLTNNFLYKIINDYVDFDYLINASIRNNTLNIGDTISGYFFVKELPISFELRIKNEEIEGIVIKGATKEELTAKKINDKYISTYKTQNKINSYENMYLIKKIFKQTIYNQNKKMRYKEEIKEKEANIRLKELIPIEVLSEKEIEKMYLIDDVLLKKNHVINLYKPSRNKTKYFISYDYKKGVYASEDVILDAYYLGFNEISKQKYKKYNKNI